MKKFEIIIAITLVTICIAAYVVIVSMLLIKAFEAQEKPTEKVTFYRIKPNEKLEALVAIDTLKF